jgi:hypothetical protein
MLASGSVSGFIGKKMVSIIHECPVYLYLLLPFLIIFLFISAPVIVILMIAASFGDIVFSGVIPVGASHVPKYYSPGTNNSGVQTFVFMICGSLFGALHCIGWNFTFPTYAEQMLWRVTSLAVAVIPIVFVGFAIPTLLFRHRTNGVVLWLSRLLLAMQFFLYMLARLSLLVQALVLLRKQPTGAFRDIDWLKFIPHL